jgi:hypothetical protein
MRKKSEDLIPGIKGSTKHRPPKFGVATSVYLSPLFSSEYRQLCEERYGVSGSFRLNEFMLKDLAEMKGQTLPSQTNISALEMRVANLIARGKKFKAFLVKLGVYSDLEDLAIKWRLDVESFGNMDSIIDKFLSYKLQPTDHFTKDDIELFVQLLSLVKEKTLKKAELDKSRLNRIRGTPAPVPPGSLPETSTPKAGDAVSVSVTPASVVTTEAPTQSQSETTGAIKSNLDSSQLEILHTTNPTAKETLDDKKAQQTEVDRVAKLLESTEGGDETLASVG